MAEGEHSHTTDSGEHSGWQYKHGDSNEPASQQDAHQAVAQSGPSIDWTASEFIAHPKTAMWYLIFGGGAVAIAALIYVVTHDYISVVVVALLALIMGYSATRQPRVVAYSLDNGGLTVGKQFHPYGHYKSFAVVDEGAFSSITLLPLKRFNWPLSIYFAPEDEHNIMDILAKHLPLQPGQLDTVDEIMRSLHF